jgi:hypothetical protein
MLRTLKLNAEFVIGFLAEGFSHRFKVERGLPADSQIVSVNLDPDHHVIFLGILSAAWDPADAEKMLDVVIHELPE